MKVNEGEKNAMKALQKICLWLGLGLYGLNFWVLLVYGYKVFSAFDSFIFDLTAIILSPLIIYIGIKFFTKIKERLSAVTVLYTCLFFMVHSELWLGSVFAFLVAYFLDESIGRDKGIALDTPGSGLDSNEYDPYRSKTQNRDKVFGGFQFMHDDHLE